jgi:hypothetical protein
MPGFAVAQKSIYSLFEELYQDSKAKFQDAKLDDYHYFVKENKLQDLPESRDIYYRIAYLHELFTSDWPEDGSRGGLLDIPYFWHWVEPNSRLEISKADILISSLPVDRYASYAMVDRTPEIFLSDLVDSMYFSHPDYGNFYTFGWCSEREMSYRSILRHWGFNSKVVAYGGHSWTEVVADFISTKGKGITLYISVDNTFNDIKWQKHSDTTKRSKEELRLERWYNKISDYDVDVYVTEFNRQRIRWQVRKYL